MQARSFLPVLQASMKPSLCSLSAPLRAGEGLPKEKRTSRLSQHGQLRQLLVELIPVVIANIIELYAARPQLGAFDNSGSIQIFTGDWMSPNKTIIRSPQLPVQWVYDVCEFQGVLVVMIGTDRGWSIIVADKQGNLQESTVSSGSKGTLVQFKDNLYTFGCSHFAVFDHRAKCFLPDINLPHDCTGVTNACVFKGRLYLLRVTSGPNLCLTCFDVDISKWHDEGTLPEVSISRMCANDKNIFFYGFDRPKKSHSPGNGRCRTSSKARRRGFIVTWNHVTRFTATESVEGMLRLITCDNDYIYFVNRFNIVVLYEISTKQFIPDPAPIEEARSMSWFDVSSPKIF